LINPSLKIRFERQWTRYSRRSREKILTKNRSVFGTN
jgi:hypothetical protein